MKNKKAKYRSLGYYFSIILIIMFFIILMSFILNKWIT